MLIHGITLLCLVLAAGLWGAGLLTVWQALGVLALAWLALVGVAFGVLCLICAVVDVSKPQERDSKFYRQVMYLYIDALIVLLRVRIHTRGLENTPREGRFLLVCNHLDLPDPGILLHCFRKSQLAFVSKQENQTMFVVGKFMHKIMCQLINRENDREALKTILKCIQLLKEDQVSIGIFPEGYANKDGRLRHFRAGAFKIAQKAKVPIVVCTIRNTPSIIPNLRRLRPTDVELHLTGVIPAEELVGKSTTQISDRVYEMMIADLGEEFRAIEAPEGEPAPEQKTDTH